MSVFDHKILDKNYIKVRWKEPYVSHALNRKDFGSKPRGIFSGFNIIPVGYREYQIEGSSPIGFNFQGNPDEYAQGAYDATSGYSIATFSDNLGHETSIVIPPGSVSGTFNFDFSGEHDSKKIIALDVDYLLSNESTGRVLAVDEAEIDDNPDYLVIGVINLPSDGVSATGSDVDFNDDNYPRILPFATPFKYGYMSPQQALTIANIGDEVDAIYCSHNDADIWWRIYGVSGGGVGRLDFTGNIFYNQPTADWNLQVTTSGMTVSGIDQGDVLFFQYPTDGSVTGLVPLQVASNNNLPIPPVGYQTSIFGMRCGNDFWFKNGQKWEVGEYKPFGVTSKFPNLYVGETGNPPGSESVSGIFFDNAQVNIQPGGKDVRVFVNVSGSLPPQTIEEEHLVTSITGQTLFTAIDPGLFWVLDDTRVDIKVYRNGVKQTQYTTDTSGVFFDDSSPIWQWRKAGTRTIEFRNPVPKDGVITLLLEAHRSIYALEQTFLVSSASGQDLFTSVYPFSADNDVPDIQLYRNGVKVQYGTPPFNPNIYGAAKVNETQVRFFKGANPFYLPKDSVVTLRHEGGSVAPGSSVSGGGDFWFTPVDSNIEPDADAVHSFGLTNRFKNANFSDDVAMGGDCYIGGKLNVSGGIDPTYIQLTPINPSLVVVPDNSFFVDSTAGYSLLFKDQSGIDNVIISSTSGISIEEDELMANPYPFAIEAPRAISLSTSGNMFLLTNFQDPESTKNFFGILTQNVSAYGSGQESGTVKWRGKLAITGHSNGAIYVSGNGVNAGKLVEIAPSVSGASILSPGIIKNNVLFIRPSEALTL